jgi:hypothetical protein
MHAGGSYDHKDGYTLLLAHKKVDAPWGQVLVRGIFANWLVGIATYMANAAQVWAGAAAAGPIACRRRCCRWAQVHHWRHPAEHSPLGLRRPWNLPAPPTPHPTPPTPPGRT